jgi:hypothetical protein
LPPDAVPVVFHCHTLNQAGRQMWQMVLARYQAHGEWLEWLNKEE